MLYTVAVLGSAAHTVLPLSASDGAPFYDDDGNATMQDSVDIDRTVTEPIADGFYYSRTVQLLKTLLENPELLQKSLKEEIEYG